MSGALALRLPSNSWVEQRAEYIGGSDVAAILGKSTYKTPLQLWKQKLGLMQDIPDPNITRFGHLFEPTLAQYFSDVTGLKVQQAHHTRVDKQYPFLRANLDRLILSSEKHPSPGILELKTTNAFSVKQWTEAYPVEWMYQIQHYLMITGYSYAYLQVYERDTCKYHEPVYIQRDETLIQQTRKTLVDWWVAHIVHQKRPKAISDEDLMILYPEAIEEKTVQGSAFTKAQYQSLLDVRKSISKLQQAEATLIHFLKSEMGEAEILQAQGQTLCTWKNQRTSRLDQARLKREQPALFKQYVTESVSRRFNLKS